MAPRIDYYFAPQSPYTYLGHSRLVAAAKAADATVQLLPMDLGGKIFPVSGGLPLGQRAPQRLAYRLVELQRFSEHLGLPLNLKPKFFPVAGDAVARLIIAVDQLDGADAALQFTGAVLAAVWAQDRNIADADVQAALLAECGLHADRLADAQAPAVQIRYEANTQQAIDAGVFGAPSYVLNGEIFWGQDRVDFLARALEKTPG